MRPLFYILLLLLPAALWAGTKGDALQQATQRIGLPVLADSILPPGAYNITYQSPADSAQVVAYLQLLQTEYSKYPTGYLPKLGLRQIVLAHNLQINGQARTAIPDATTQTLYLEIDGLHAQQDSGYLIHVMHHELHHYAEYAKWGDMYYNWRKWKCMNQHSFRYLGAGDMAYANLVVDWYSFTHPKPGFMNMYSTTAPEEDRCELIGLLMSSEGVQHLRQYFLTDNKLRRKVKAVVKLLNNISHTRSNYWTTQLINLKRKPF